MLKNLSEHYLTTDDAAKRLGVSERTVMRWVRVGLLRAFRLGSVTRIATDDFEKFIFQNTRQQENETDGQSFN